ncbi:DUF819 family protein [Lutispora thermophila]|uniref:Uncharacterized membrane protein n=1 Tax=Lutispora thermophila DSM 19022 TaxID=1122184 RepID=A0A1M6BQH9_9FIRM|nr:DUF819 family protein [Lutispora thermophila]SHI51005.1 Uncharacterized membrane protein [Lutispora thermophila DSM 19022]
MNSFIKPDQTWVLWAILTGLAAVSIYLEGKYKWAEKVTSSIIALGGALILSNLHIIPTESPVYDTVWSYIIPLAIPMLLFNCNMKKIWKESGRLLGIFLIGAIGTVLGAFIGYFALHKYVPGLKYVAAIMTGSYIGGGVNFVALSDAFNVPSELVASATVADNLLMALYFFVLLAMPSIPFFRKHFSHPLVDEIETSGFVALTSQSESSKTSKIASITLKDIAFVVATSFIIVAVSTELAGLFSKIIPTSNPFLQILNSLLGNMYLVLTTLTMLLATFKSDFFSSLKGAQEIGMFFMAIFMAVIGVPASISQIIFNAPLLLVFCGIMVAVNMFITLLGAKIFKFNLEEAIIASNANIGGPATASAMASAKGWTPLVGPSVLVAVFGYIIGNYLGIIVGNILI